MFQAKQFFEKVLEVDGTNLKALFRLAKVRAAVARALFFFSFFGPAAA